MSSRLPSDGTHQSSEWRYRRDVWAIRRAYANLGPQFDRPHECAKGRILASLSRPPVGPFRLIPLASALSSRTKRRGLSRMTEPHHRRRCQIYDIAANAREISSANVQYSSRRVILHSQFGAGASIFNTFKYLLPPERFLKKHEGAYY